MQKAGKPAVKWVPAFSLWDRGDPRNSSSREPKQKERVALHLQ